MDDMVAKIPAIIPARGGSKGIPRKNILNFCGKPLIAWTIQAAKESKYISEIIVSTEDKEIAEISKQYGADVPFMRPKRLATDNSIAIDTYLFTIEKLNLTRKIKINDFVILQPTSPLRTSHHIDEAIEQYFKKKAESLISIYENPHPINWNKELDKHGYIKNVDSENKLLNRQEYSKTFLPNGAITILKYSMLKKYRTYYFPLTTPYLMKKNESVDIDDKEDWEIAELFFKKTIKSNNFDKIKSIIEKKPVLILGSGIHRYLTEINDSPFCSWRKLFEETCKYSSIEYKYDYLKNMPLNWDAILTNATIDGYYYDKRFVNGKSSKASETEKKIKSNLQRVLTDNQYIRGINLFMIEAFKPAAILSLNFDNLWIDDKYKIKKEKLPKKPDAIKMHQAQYSQLFDRELININNQSVPLYFPNGKLSKYEYIRLGYREFGLQANSLQQGVDYFKMWERKLTKTKTDKKYKQIIHNEINKFTEYELRKLVERRITWINYFMTKPILIIGAAISDSEIGLRWLFIQRERNFARRGEKEPVYQITTDKHCINKEKEYKMMGIEKIYYKVWDEFWNEIEKQKNGTV